MDVDGEHLLVTLERVGDIGCAQQFPSIELDQGIGIADAALAALEKQLVDECGVAVAMETHQCCGWCGSIGHLLGRLLRGASQHGYRYQE